MIVSKGSLKESDDLLRLATESELVFQPLDPHDFRQTIQSLDLLPISSSLIKVTCTPMQIN